jgi:translation elongation factor EF-1alpha
MDCAKWSQDRYTKIRDEIRPFLRDDCGFDVEKNVKFVPVSGFKD